MTSITDEIYMTPADVAARLQVSTETLRCWRRDGKGPRFFEEGKTARYTEKQLQDWITMKQGAAHVEKETSTE